MNYYIARQPIFDIKTSVFGYELLYRSGDKPGHLSVDGDVKTLEVMNNSLMLIGFEQMTRGKKAFINFTRNLLEQDMATILPPKHVVIEILEDIEPDESVLAACRRLKNMGYTLALDDFVYDAKFQPFIELADIIKVDFMITTEYKDRLNLTRLPAAKHIRFLAEKVETREDVDMAIQMGYTYFQGYFFEKPSTLVAKDIPPAKHVYFQLLREVNRPELDIKNLERLIQTDPSLTVKLLRFINSVGFGLRNKVSSIKQTLVLLGPPELRKWISLVVMHGLAGDKTDELIVAAISRAYQCEKLAEKTGLISKKSDMFLLGLLSLIDVMLEQPMEQILQELSLDEELKGALEGKPGRYRDLLNMVTCNERGSWDVCGSLFDQYSVEGDYVSRVYLESLQFANEMAS